MMWRGLYRCPPSVSVREANSVTEIEFTQKPVTIMPKARLELNWRNFIGVPVVVARRVFNLPWAVLLANLWSLHLAAAPAHPQPYLMPPVEKQRLLERLRSSESARKQFEAIKARANQGKFAD